MGLDSDGVLALSVLVLRLMSLPLTLLIDCLTWPIVRRTLGRGSWWVVEVKFHGFDAELVRLAEAVDEAGARQRLREIAARHAGRKEF